MFFFSVVKERSENRSWKKNIYQYNMKKNVFEHESNKLSFQEPKIFSSGSLLAKQNDKAAEERGHRVFQSEVIHNIIERKKEMKCRILFYVFFGINAAPTFHKLPEPEL